MAKLLFLIFLYIFFRWIIRWMNRLITILSNRLTNGSLKKSKRLYEAMEKNDFTLFKKLVESGTTFKYITKDDNPIIHELMKPKNIQYLNYLHQKKLLFSAKKNTPFFWPADRGYVDLEEKDKFGQTVLHKACQFDNFNAVRLLINYHVRLHEPSNDGNIPLFLISESTEILDLFKKNSTPEEWQKFCTEHRNKNGQNLIHAIILAHNGYKECYNLSNNDPIVSDIFKENKGNNTFYGLVKNDNTKVAQYILNEFPDLLNQKNSEQKTPLHLAVIYRCHDMLDFLLKYKGLDVTVKDIDGDTAAMYALYWNDSSDTFSKIVEYDNKALNVPNSKGEIPLIFYIKYILDPKALLPVVTWLIKIGSDLRVQDNDGNTALHYAIMQQNQEVINIIIKKNPELVKIRNNNYETPFEVTPNQLRKIKQ